MTEPVVVEANPTGVPREGREHHRCWECDEIYETEYSQSVLCGPCARQETAT